MNEFKLFTPTKIGYTDLKNRVVMASATRCVAIGNLPNVLMNQYYVQPKNVGLIITEGTSPSPNGLGYARMPGIFSLQKQGEGWEKITSSVHVDGGKIFVLLLHTGRISHPLNMPEGAQVLAPSAVKATGKIWTDSEMMQDFPVPKEMTNEDLIHTKIEFIAAAKNALDTGFDGVEVDAANGYLFEQFLSPISNIRSDRYGGSIENRCKFVLEVVREIAEAIGKDKIGICLSPYSVESNMPLYPEIYSTYIYLAEQLNKIGIAYIHLVEDSSLGISIAQTELQKQIRKIFKNTIIIPGGYNDERAEADIQIGLGDLVALEQPFINNHDWFERFENDCSLLQDIRINLFYSKNEVDNTDDLYFKDR
jgi:N-ethylmaleimide reductase